MSNKLLSTSILPLFNVGQTYAGERDEALLLGLVDALAVADVVKVRVFVCVCACVCFSCGSAHKGNLMRPM